MYSLKTTKQFEKDVRLCEKRGLEWLDLHREEIKEAWEMASKGENPNKIEPLK